MRRVAEVIAAMRGAGSTMAVALRRFLLDSIYVVVFFVVATTAAYGINRTVTLCRSGGMEGPVVWILEALEVCLAAIDALGVAFAAGYLTLRFVDAVRRAD